MRRLILTLTFSLLAFADIVAGLPGQAFAGTAAVAVEQHPSVHA
jgi:hypothetical protein